jgi:RHS repeat-associated protein
MRVIVPREVSSYSYAGAGYANPHAVTSVGGTTSTYDNNGNVTAIDALDYTWDWRNRLAIAERSGGGNTTYGYDHTGQRVVQATGSATTSYPNRYYNVASSSLTATTTKHIFSPDGTLLATVVGSGTSTASTTYLHPDHLGGTNVATDEDGAVSRTLDYYPYGSPRINTGSFSEQRRFIGEEYDPDTGFSYLNARYYEGNRGQFMSQDPVFLALGSGRWDRQSRENLQALLSDPQFLNAYSYARNNPLIFVDKSGELAFVPLVILGLQVYSAFSLGYSAGEVLNRDFLFRGSYSSQERNAARFNLGFNIAAEGAAYGLADDVKDAYLTLGPDAIDLFEKLTGAAEGRKRREEQRSESHANVTITNHGSYGGSSSGGAYNYIYSKPFGSIGGNNSGQGSYGGYGFSATQQGALQSFESVVNAPSFDAQAFVSALQAVVNAFSND